MTTIFCFGDSNTYGYDPRSWLGSRYPAQVRWTDRLASATDWQVENCGLNGREIPRGRFQQQLVWDFLSSQSHGTGALGFWVMLGSNDLLNHPTFTAQDVAERMGDFLDFLLPHPLAASGRLTFRLIAPPAMIPGDWVTEERLLMESRRLGECYRQVAAERNLPFADATGWEIPMTFDGVHFSEEGHKLFADKLLQSL